MGGPKLRPTVLHSDQLAVHPDLAVQEVDTVRGEAEHLTRHLTRGQAHAGGEDDHGPVAAVDGVGEGLDLGHLEGHHLAAVPLGQGDADARRSGDEAIGHGCLEDGGHPAVDDLRCGGSEDVADALHPPLDLAAPDGGEGPVAESRVGVVPEVSLGLLGG